MKLKKWLGLVVLSIALAGCSSSDDNGGGNNTDDDGGGNGNSTYDVAIEVGPLGFNVQYEYYDDGSLETWTTSYTSTTGYELTFTYNDDGSVFSEAYIDSEGDTDALSFQYDFEGHLIGYVGLSNDLNNDVTLAWNGNIVTATGTIAGNEGVTAVMELDNAGRVVRLIATDYYASFTYDTNGNLTNMFTFDLDDNLLNQFTVTYDSNPNPFFGQLQSIYMERFLTNFYQQDGVYYSGIEGYTFPYHRNNILSIERNGAPFVNYGIAYDNNDYPVVINETKQGELFQYQLTYY